MVKEILYTAPARWCYTMDTVPREIKLRIPWTEAPKQLRVDYIRENRRQVPTTSWRIAGISGLAPEPRVEYIEAEDIERKPAIVGLFEGFAKECVAEEGFMNRAEFGIAMDALGPDLPKKILDDLFEVLDEEAEEKFPV